MSSFILRSFRMKTLDVLPGHELKRCLTTFDLTLLGLGSMIGSGIYVLVGVAAKDMAGPAVVVSFILAGLVALVSALILAEFASLIPQAGSTYLYTYCTLGELPAFLIGIAMVFGIMLSASTTAHAWSSYMDSLFDGYIHNMTIGYVGRIHLGPLFSESPDLLAAAFVAITTLVVSIGVTCTTKVTALFAFLNICVLLTVTITGFAHADITNWTSEETHGFMPYGVSGILSGSVACYWAFTGYSIIAISAGEAVNPRKSIIRAMLITLTTVTVLYVSTSCALTLMTPYTSIHTDAPLTATFNNIGLPWIQYLLCLGPLCGMTTSLLSCQIAVVRIIFAISSDGLIFPFFAHQGSKMKVPVITTLLTGILIAIFSCFIDLKHSITCSVVLSLLQYELISLGILIHRYKSRNISPIDNQIKNILKQISNEPEWSDIPPISPGNSKKLNKSNIDIFDDDSDDLFELEYQQILTCPYFTKYSQTLILLYLSLSLLISVYFVIRKDQIMAGQLFDLLVMAVVLLLMATIILTLTCACKQSTEGLILKWPWVPIVPCLSIGAKMFLITLTTTGVAWIGIGSVFIIGLVLYFSYGIHHSKCKNVSKSPNKHIR